MGFKDPWGETLLPWGKGVDSHMLEASREGYCIQGAWVPLLKMGLRPQVPLL